MLRLRLLVVLASSVLASSFVACMDSPTFVLDENETTTNISGTSPDDEDVMVLVPATTFPAQGTLAPAAPGNDNDDDDDDDDNEGKNDEAKKG